MISSGFIRKFLYRLKRKMVPKPRPAKMATPKMHPEEPGKPRVLLLVSNPVDHDTRVKKTAASLRRRGYCVGILGIANPKVAHTYDDPGLTRVAFDNAFYRYYFRRELRALARLDAQRRAKQTAVKAVSNRLQMVERHDDLLRGLGDRRTLVGKLSLIWKQYRIIKRKGPSVRVANKCKEDLRIFNVYYAEEKNRLREKIKSKKSKFSRYSQAAKHFDFYCTFRNRIKQFRPDIIHANDLLTLPAAIRYRKKAGYRVKVIYDAHELEMHRNKSYDFLRNVSDQVVEWIYIRKADDVITVSEGIADELQKSYSIERPTVVLNSPSMTAQHLSKGLRKSIGLKRNSHLIAYVGVVTFGRGLDTLVRSLAYLPDDHHVAIVGPRRADRDAPLISLACDLGVSHRLHLVAPVSPGEVPSLLSEVDVAINPSTNVCLSYDLALPNKLFDAVLARVPSLVQDLREMKAFVERTRTGIARDLNTPRKIASSIADIRQLKADGYFSDTKWDSVAVEYCWEAQEKKLYDVYGKLDGGRRLEHNVIDFNNAIAA